ncbi:hypothetical protein HPB49_002442 [Dermacentor silvarum]|uniref:Uncharacterized protein n=1 Tax=Dermacentor silvarum TaxID=543639 RepID=A0ACB8C1R8_DERSI|nr:hypothetical protein HPB49_002442 [Dermacentor silvarum]
MRCSSSVAQRLRRRCVNDPEWRSADDTVRAERGGGRASRRNWISAVARPSHPVQVHGSRCKVTLAKSAPAAPTTSLFVPDACRGVSEETFRFLVYRDSKPAFNGWIGPVHQLEKTGILTGRPGKILRCKSPAMRDFVGLKTAAGRDDAGRFLSSRECGAPAKGPRVVQQPRRDCSVFASRGQALTMEQLRGGENEQGDCGRSASDRPEWFDAHKFHRAKEIFREHLFSFFFAHLVGLAMVVTKPSILEPLASTGRSSTLSSLYRRYLSTLRHVKCWYEGDIWGPDDAAALSIAKVRQMHRDASAQLRNRRCPVTGATYLSQLDMAVTQFAFVGLVVLYPRQLGLFLSERDLECVLHFWRCVGYKLGMADSYNLCSGSYRETFDVCLDMQEKLIKPGLVNASREASAMSKDIISAVRVLVIFLSYEGMMAYWARQVGLEFNAALSLYDWWSYCLIWLTFNLLLRYRTFRNMFNWLLRVAIRRGTKWGGYLQKQLEAQELHAKGMHLSYAYRYH